MSDLLSTSFLETFGSESLVHQLLIDAGAECDQLFSPMGDRRVSKNREKNRAGRYWSELLIAFAKEQSWDQNLMMDAFVDYWFLYTVINSASGPARQRGDTAFGFLCQMDHHLTSLGANFCPDVAAPRMPAQVLRHNRLEANFHTPRGTPFCLLHAAIPRIGNLFGERLEISKHARRNHLTMLSIHNVDAPATLGEQNFTVNYPVRGSRPSTAMRHT